MSLILKCDRSRKFIDRVKAGRSGGEIHDHVMHITNMDTLRSWDLLDITVTLRIMMCSLTVARGSQSGVGSELRRS